jgi:hypothetical protein
VVSLQPARFTNLGKTCFFCRVLMGVVVWRSRAAIHALIREQLYRLDVDITTHPLLVRANGHSPSQAFASFSNQIGISSFVIPHSSSIVPHSSSTILHSSSTILHSCFVIPHSSSIVPHSCFVIPHSSSTILHSCFRVLHSCCAILRSSSMVPYGYVAIAHNN